MAAEDKAQQADGRKATVGLAVFIVYVAVLALAALSELFELGWFDHPLFK
jgi:hypothetical protein